MWSAAGLLFLAYLAPGFQTPLLYHQQDDLHFTPHDMGRLLLVGAIGAIAGSAAYGWLCRRLPLRTLLIGGILLNAGEHPLLSRLLVARVGHGDHPGRGGAGLDRHLADLRSRGARDAARERELRLRAA